MLLNLLSICCFILLCFTTAAEGARTMNSARVRQRRWVSSGAARASGTWMPVPISSAVIIEKHAPHRSHWFSWRRARGQMHGPISSVMFPISLVPIRFLWFRFHRLTFRCNCSLSNVPTSSVMFSPPPTEVRVPADAIAQVD